MSEAGTLQNHRKPSYLPGLDGWRAIAIFAVICSHDPDSHGIGFLNTWRMHQVGWAGVDLFFAISGLLICSRLLEEEQMNGRISLRGFYTRRVFRIFPAAYAFLAVCLALGFSHQIPGSLPATLAAALMIRNYWGIYSGVPPNELYTDHFWSLSVEEHFYLILPAVLVFVRRRILLLAIMSAAAFSWFLLFIRYGKVTNSLSLSRTDLRLHGLLIPALLALVLARPGIRDFARRWVRPWFWIALVCILGTTIHRLSLGLRIGVVGICFPFLVLSTLLHPQSIACRILEWKPLRYVGRLSYGIYLWQQIFMFRSAPIRWPFAALQAFRPLLLCRGQLLYSRETTHQTWPSIGAARHAGKVGPSGRNCRQA
ncbi:MAG TPA: acyltransferase [Bryobacteraceae bacterium]|jgi:peptidoglycan/LPS O-acetylase OafA/YrhL